MSTHDESRFPLRLDALTRFKVERWYKQDGCQSRNDFVLRAINFYVDYLDGQENCVLPPDIQSAIDGRLGLFEDRMAKILFKLTVETDIGISALLSYLKIDPDYLRKLRVESVKNVKATNGRLTFEQKVVEDDEVWQG